MSVARRTFIAGLGAAAAWPLAARGQQGERMRHIAILVGNDSPQNMQLFRDELAKLGYVEGRNLRVDIRFGGGDLDRIRAYAAELVMLMPEVIATQSAAAAIAVQQQTRTIPIVITGAGDPVANGIVKDMAHPEGNTTGITNLYASIGGKWLQLLKEIVPGIERVALIYNARVTPDDQGYGYLPSIDEAANALSVQVARIGYRDAVDLVHGIDQFGTQAKGAVIVVPPAPSEANVETIVRLANLHRLPAMYQDRQYAAAGGLAAYGSVLVERMRRAASIVDRILRGAKVSELPVEFPTKFELVINLKAAKAIGLTIPEAVLLRADELIQ